MHRSIRMAALVLVACACGNERPRDAATSDAPPAGARAASPAGTALAYTATDYGFSGPTQAPAGAVTFTLKNAGKEPHHLVVLRLEQGRTYDSLVAALKKPGRPPAWIHPVSGPNGISAGEEANAQLVLEPGPHAVICFVPTAEGIPHFAKGMMSPLEVTAGDGAPHAELPPADIVLTLSDYTFTMSAPLTSGRHVIEVRNGAAQMHEVVLARLHPGKTAAQLAEYQTGGRKGEEPGTYIGGASPMGPGDHARFVVDLPPGHYGLICFVPDAGDGKPHTAHGMIKDLTVS